MNDLEEVVQSLRNIKTYLSSQAIIASVERNDIAREGLIESQADIEKAIELLKSQQERIEKMRSLLGEADEEIKRLKSKDQVLQFGDNPIT